MRDLVEALRRQADAVILDSPPVLVVTDATLLAALADGTVLVAEVGRTRSGALHQAVDGLSRATDRLLGVVLNKTGRRWSPGYYHHHYYHADDAPSKGRAQRVPKLRSPQDVPGVGERVA
jgi:Mrp family chromosome partitioning ATPase